MGKALVAESSLLFLFNVLTISNKVLSSSALDKKSLLVLQEASKRIVEAKSKSRFILVSFTAIMQSQCHRD